MPPEVTMIGLRLAARNRRRRCASWRARARRCWAPGCRRARRRPRRPCVVKLVDAMAEAQRHEPSLLALAHARDERRDDAGPGAPGDVEARHRVAVLGRRDSRRARPSRRSGTSARPWRAARRASRRPRRRHRPRPTCAASGPPRGRSRPSPASPAAPGRGESRMRMRRCSGRVDEEQAAERPERLPAQRLLAAPGRAGSPCARPRSARRRRPARRARRRRR